MYCRRQASMKEIRSISPIFTFLVLIALSLIFGLIAIPSGRAIQLTAWASLFTLPVLLPIQNKATRKWIFPILFLGFSILFIDFGIRGFLYHMYEASPTSAFVIESLLNTNQNESFEFFQANSIEILCWIAISFTFIALITLILLYWVKAKSISFSHPKTTYALFIFFICFIVASWVIKPWRAHLPPMEWVNVASKIESLRADWNSITEEIAQEGNAAEQHITKLHHEAETIVLVIGESINRDNMSLYGYARDTTPRLKAESKKPGFFYAKEAWSTRSSTVEAFHSMFSFALDQHDKVNHGNVFAFFQKAGWYIEWISNQDDLAIKSEYASWAKNDLFLNRAGGRTSNSMDEKVLVPLKEALNNPAPKKLIIVHLIGIHPNYSLRSPSDYSVHWSDEDTVSTQLKEKDRSLRTQIARNDYDRAMLYQDKILTETLELTQKASENQSVLWLFLSDHGNETGNCLDRTGHSPVTLSGYKIPFMLWASPKFTKQEDLQHLPQEFRADWLSEMLFDAAGIHWKNSNPTRSILESNYQYQEPEIISSLKKRPCS